MLITGIGYFFTDSTDEEEMGWTFAKFVFQASFATTATTIVSGNYTMRVIRYFYCITHSWSTRWIRFTISHNMVCFIPSNTWWMEPQVHISPRGLMPLYQYKNKLSKRRNRHICFCTELIRIYSSRNHKSN